MRTLALIPVVLCASILAAQSVSAQPKRCSVAVDDKAIRQVAEEFKNAYNNRAPDRIAALYAEDATYLTQHFITGIVDGRRAIRAYFKNGIDANYKIDSIEVLATDCSGDSAYSITRYESTNGPQKAFGVNLVVLRKINGKWLMVAHESAVPDPAQAIQNLDLPKE